MSRRIEMNRLTEDDFNTITRHLNSFLDEGARDTLLTLYPHTLSDATVAEVVDAARDDLLSVIGAIVMKEMSTAINRKITNYDVEDYSTYLAEQDDSLGD